MMIFIIIYCWEIYFETIFSFLRIKYFQLRKISFDKTNYNPGQKKKNALNSLKCTYNALITR